jgi:pSer/pThr/pTyr-binding forkhead associated (FHA) protein
LFSSVIFISHLHSNRISSNDSLSLLIDLSQFRLSHAALIHLRSKHVIYIRKHCIWFGSSVSNDICLTKFNDEQTCAYVADRHACLYYDRKRNIFELLNYSAYGTIVNGLRYGLGNISDDESDHDDYEYQAMENEILQKCFCLTPPTYHSAWDGPAHIEQGTVVQIGCHEFLFYRHVVR